MPQRVMYEVEIRHDGLGAYRHIRGSEYHVVMQKAQAQQRAWEERWRKLHQKEETINKKLAKKEQAEARAAAAILALKNIEDTAATDTYSKRHCRLGRSKRPFRILDTRASCAHA